MIKKIKKKLLNIFKIKYLQNEIENLSILNGKILAKLNKLQEPSTINDIEFKVFSQFGDDGIIQFLISRINFDETNKSFVEFGVENYQESNTRFLLFNDNWSGLVIDSSRQNIQQIKKSGYYWKYDLEAICSFITKENINNILEHSKMSRKIGILSIDVDGNDYWIWENITYVDPIIVIIEFNSNFGFEQKISVPYKENFIRTEEHYSNLYWGASLEAFKFLAQKKGYKFFCTNTAGNNAYFVKESNYKDIKTKFNKNYYEAKFRESRDKDGKKNLLKGKEKINEILDLDVIDVEKNRKFKIREIVK